MNLTKNFVVLMIAVFAILLGSFALAKNPFQTEEFEIIIPDPDDPGDPGTGMYISCLDEYVGIHVFVTIRFREFDTPSGNNHYIEYWKSEAEWTGLGGTNRTWFSHGHSPGAFHVGPGDIGQWTSHEMAKPVAGDGPKFRYNQRFKYTFNANGDLKVLWEPPEDLADWIRCLGPGD